MDMTPEEYEAQVADILGGIPEIFHEALRAYAWERGHAYGYQEVLTVLENLVSILEEPFQRYQKEILAALAGS